ncbi:MAG: hypothetical protein IPK82_14910 [Polyangiaceae bacterium]|nr:hypothetical protein [Polyangiaceae bacterium]
MAISLRELSSNKNVLRDFLNVVDHIYAGDSNYVRPLDFDVSDRLNAKKNPFFEHAEGTGWVAYRDGTPVGRITAQIDREHLARHKDDAGFFGFLDTVDDPEVANLLLAEAEAWVKARGMKKIRGPFSLNINEETGCLVEGFDSPPNALMTYHRPYQSGLIEKAGFQKVKDLYSWGYVVGAVPPRAQKAHDEVVAMPEISARPISIKNIHSDVQIVMDIFNDAWSENWGFVPLTQNELKKMADDFKLILVPELTSIVSINGEPAAVSLAMPNINEAIADLKGQLFPFGFMKLLYRLKVRGVKTGRLVILGIRKKYRHIRRYGGLSAYLYVEMNKAAHLIGLETGELGWTLEDNAAINAGIRLMGGKIVKRYRIYEKALF